MTELQSQPDGVEAIAKSATSSRIPLDEVMLAMDVVDTLRHQRSLIETELDEESREKKLIARIKSIYESQGMEVPDAVIAKGVKALSEDRFKYDLPKRTFQVRLAEIYVERWKWSRRLLIAVLIAVVIWAAFAIPSYFRRKSQIDSFRDRLGSVQIEVDSVRERATALRRAMGNVLPIEGSQAAAEIVSDADVSLRKATEEIQALSAKVAPGPDPEDYPDNIARFDSEVTEQQDAAVRIRTDLDSVAEWLRTLSELRSVRTQAKQVLNKLDGVSMDSTARAEMQAMQASVLQLVEDGELEEAQKLLSQLESRIHSTKRLGVERRSRRATSERLRTSMTGVDLDADAKRDFDTLVTNARRALDAGNDQAAAQVVARLSELVDELNVSYDLRIIARRGQRSGVWRYPDNRRGARNYYIVVEAIGANRHRLTLPILNEENQRTFRVSTFAIRVDKSVFEGVKRDKLDNGIIDKRLFGKKRRGSRKLEYFFPVAGGMITRW